MKKLLIPTITILLLLSLINVFADGESSVSTETKPADTSIQTEPLPTQKETNIPTDTESVTSETITQTSSEPVPVFHRLIITYQYSDGKTAYESYETQIRENDSFSVPSPSVKDHSPDQSTVSGIMGQSDISIAVTYTANTKAEWIFGGNKISYNDGNKIVSGTKTIDGRNYTFDADGYLSAPNSFVSINGNDYYLDSSNNFATGYKVINDGIYCFDGSGKMIKNTQKDGYTFDINGRIKGNDLLFVVSGKSYYMLNDTLQTGYMLINGNICYFNDQCEMVQNSTVNGYVFDAQGVMISAININDLYISPIYNITYAGYQVRPDVTVSFEGLTLTEGVHYTLSYGENNKPGTGSVTITGMNIVSGEKTVNFKILKEGRKLTIKYVSDVGMNIAESYVEVIEVGEKYSVESPKVKGYVTKDTKISGTMPDKDITVTVKYTKEGAADPSKTEGGNEGANKNEGEIFEQSLTYNYKLFFTVLIISTVVFGGAILMIINWDMIVHYFRSFKEKRAKKKPF